MTEPTPSAPPGPSRWRRRASFLLLALGLGIIIWRLWLAQPVDVEVVFHYGAVAHGLKAAAIRYLQSGEELRRVRFSYEARPPQVVQRHSLRLPTGDYEVLIELVHEVSTAGAPARPRALRRPLLVRGAGEFNLYLDDRTE